MDATEYQINITKYASPDFASDKANAFDIMEFLDDIVVTSELLDKTKRALFYKGAPSAGIDEVGILGRITTKSDKDFIHGVLGCVTEAGEIAKSFVTTMDKFASRPDDAVLEIDIQNTVEELGDILFYCSLVAKAIGVPFSDLLTSNTRKIEKRFGAEFTAQAALNRNTVAEMNALGHG